MTKKPGPPLSWCICREDALSLGSYLLLILRAICPLIGKIEFFQQLLAVDRSNLLGLGAAEMFLPVYILLLL